MREPRRPHVRRTTTWASGRGAPTIRCPVNPTVYGSGRAASTTPKRFRLRLEQPQYHHSVQLQPRERDEELVPDLCIDDSQKLRAQRRNAGGVGASAGTTRTIICAGDQTSGREKPLISATTPIMSAKARPRMVSCTPIGPGGQRDTYFYDNFFYVQGTARFGYGVAGNPDGSYTSAPGPGKSANSVYDYNVYYGLQPAGDPHAITVDPLLLDPGHARVGRSGLAGYALRNNSPAIASGKVIEGHGATDFFGTSLDQCRGIDRGAVQSTRCREP